MIAQAPFHRPARVVVLHAVADERGDLAVVHLDGDLHRDFAFGREQQPPHVLAQIELIGSPVEIELGGLGSLHGRRVSKAKNGERRRHVFKA